MTLVETQHRLALEQLRRAGTQPVSLAALRAAGLDFPAAVISELELNGYAIERVHEQGRLVGVRLIEPDDSERGVRRRRHWWSRARR
jgi:biotin operon repressor